MFRKRTLPWSPWSISGPGSPSKGLMAPPGDPVHQGVVDDRLAVQDHGQAAAYDRDVEGVPLPCRLVGVELGRDAAVEGAAAMLLGGLRGVVEDLDLVAAAEVDPAVALGLDIELQVQLHVLEFLVAHQVGVALGLDHRELAVHHRPAHLGLGVAEGPTRRGSCRRTPRRARPTSGHRWSRAPGPACPRSGGRWRPRTSPGPRACRLRGVLRRRRPCRASPRARDATCPRPLRWSCAGSALPKRQTIEPTRPASFRSTLNPPPPKVSFTSVRRTFQRPRNASAPGLAGVSAATAAARTRLKASIRDSLGAAPGAAAA